MTTITITPFAVVDGQEIPRITGTFKFVRGQASYNPRTFTPIVHISFGIPSDAPDNIHAVEMIAEKLKQDFIKQFSQ